MSSHEPAGNQPQSDNEKSTQESQQAPQQEPSLSMWSETNPVAATAVVVTQGQATSSNAIVSLVLGIMSWVVCPVIFAIIALVFANKAEKEITANQGQMGGSSLVLAAKIVSWINIGFYAALLVLGLLAFFFVALVGVASN